MGRLDNDIALRPSHLGAAGRGAPPVAPKVPRGMGFGPPPRLSDNSEGTAGYGMLVGVMKRREIYGGRRF